MEQKNALDHGGGNRNRDDERKTAPPRRRQEHDERADPGRTLMDMYRIVFERLSR
jgi:hypothetical protein